MQTYEYLASVVNAQLNNSKAAKRPKELDCETLYGIAVRNHMVYLIFSELVKEDDLDDQFKASIQAMLKKSILYTLIQTTELSHMIEGFEKRGVKNLPLKGAVMKYIYPRPEQREMSDIDVLIDDNDMPKAAECLTEMGYGLKQAIKHHDVYTKPPYMLIEAHKSLYDKTVDGNQFRYFLGFDKAILKEGCSSTYVFSNEDFYVYMIAHAAKHFYAMGCGIRNLVDVYVFLKKYRDVMDMDYTRRELEKCGIADFAKNIERLAFDWLEGRELDQFEQDLFQYMMDSGIYGKDENGIWNRFCDEKKENVTKFELKRWYYFPPLYYMSEYYPWLEEKPYLLPIAWIIRFARGLFMHKGAKKRDMVKKIKRDQILVYKKIYQKMNLKFSSRS